MGWAFVLGPHILSCIWPKGYAIVGELITSERGYLFCGLFSLKLYLTLSSLSMEYLINFWRLFNVFLGINSLILSAYYLKNYSCT